MVWGRNCAHLKLWGSRFNGSSGAINTTKMFMEEDDDDPNMEMEEEYDPDQVLNAAPICPLVQLPAEICKGLSPEYFTAERKQFIQKMLPNDKGTLFDHQSQLLDFISEHQSKPFVLTYEACIGAGKTAATLALAGLLQKGPKLLYACPGEQRTVRVELGQMFFSATTTSCDVHFVFADLRQGQLILKYNEHAMRARVAREKFDEDVNPIDHHSIILASTEAAVRILADNPSNPFLLFLDEFMTSAGHKESPAFQSNMKLINLMLTRPTPQVVLSSATSMGEQAMTMFNHMGLLTKRILSSKHWTNWDRFVSGSHRWHLHRGCQMRAQVQQLELSMDKPLFARMVSETSVMDLRKVLPGLEDMVVDPLHKKHGHDWSREYRVSLQCLQQEEEGVIEYICEEQGLSPFSLRTDLQEWIDLAGKTTVLLAVSQVDAAFSIFKPDLKHVQGKVMEQDSFNEAFTENLRKVNISKLFRSCFFKKEPFHAVWKDLSVDPENQRRLNLAILLTGGIGVFSHEINEEWQEYACFVSERARLGHLHLLIADASIAHGVNFAISGVVLAKSFVEEQPASTVFQLMGRAGRRGLSDKAKILTCESWRQKLKSCLQEGHDLFELDSSNVCEALEAKPLDGLETLGADLKDGSQEVKQKHPHGEDLQKQGPESEEQGQSWWDSFVDCMKEGLGCCCKRGRS